MKFAVAICVISLACVAFACWCSVSFIENIFGCTCSDGHDNDDDDDSDDILTEDENNVE